MNTLILALILAGISFIGLGICSRNNWDGWAVFLAIVLGVSLVVMICFTGFLTLTNPQEIVVFEKQKAYFESVSPDELQNVGAIITKTEQNEWLYETQFKREKFGDWCGYPASVLDLEPIR